ncbi:TetR/AcrR family transcriptional regulator [Mycolicibacterium thermoresistibile]
MTRPLPPTARGRRSRQALLDAARKVFARDGFADARITDIADAAGAAHGSFYRYFDSKEEIFIALLRELVEELRRPVRSEPAERPKNSYERILRANRIYLEAYRANRALMIVWEQVATLNDHVEQLRREASDRFVARIERAIVRWQADGVADPALDPAYAAAALTGMLSNFAYRTSVRDPEFDVDTAAEQLSLLWANALGVRTLADDGSARSETSAATTRYVTTT